MKEAAESSFPTSNNTSKTEVVLSYTQEFKDFLATLPREGGVLEPISYQYQGFWYPPVCLQGTIDCQRNFQPRDNDVLLVTTPKSGTTWLKALIFARLHRSVHHAKSQHHPLLKKNVHSLVPFFETINHSQYDSFFTTSPYYATSDCRIFGCNIPILTMPKSVTDDSTSCKIVYLCRDIKDNMVSLRHFANKMKMRDHISMEEVFQLYIRGVTISGPVWEHILGYWKESLARPNKVLFVRFEDMKQQPSFELKRIANFLNCPLSEEEEIGQG